MHQQTTVTEYSFHWGRRGRQREFSLVQKQYLCRPSYYFGVQQPTGPNLVDEEP